MATVTIDPRFRGPDASGNGGYTCGLLARFVNGPAEVTLRKPPPLGRLLSVETGDVVRLLDGAEVVAEAKAVPLELEAVRPPTFDEALARSASYAGFKDHRFPQCFVCGTQRKEVDGLRLAPGDGPDGRVAAPWIPDASLAGADGVVPLEILWAALDCPGYWGAAGPDFPVALLGRMTGHAEPGIRAGERCVVVGWRLGREGRKIHAATALFGGDGRLRGRSKQTWIVIS